MKTIKFSVKGIDIAGMFEYCYYNNIPFSYDSHESFTVKIDEEFVDEFQKRVQSNIWSESYSNFSPNENK